MGTRPFGRDGRRRLKSRLGLEPLEERRLLAACDPDDDGEVTRTDIAILATHYGIKEGATEREGHCNEDGSIDVLDAGLMQAQLLGRRLDWGDAPDRPYPTRFASDGARHVIKANFHLGAAIDRDPNGQPGALANGDDTDLDGDDEDGVFFLTPAVPDVPQRVRVDASAAGLLDAFADFNRDGDWDDAGEQIFTSEPLVAGMNFLSHLVPLGSLTDVERPTYTRFRFSSAGGLTPRGTALDGEVEDYALFVLSASDVPRPIDVSTLWDWEMDLESAEQMPTEFKVEATGPAEFRVGPAVNTDDGMPFGLGGPDTLPRGSLFIDFDLLEMHLTATLVDLQGLEIEPCFVKSWSTSFDADSHGEMMLTALPDGTWQVDTFFDISYRIDFTESGMSLVPQDGSTQLRKSRTFQNMSDQDIVSAMVESSLAESESDERLVHISQPNNAWGFLRKLTTQRPRLDWGDAPDGPYPTLAASAGAAHVIRAGYSMGPAVDPDPNGQPHPIAEGDDGDADGDDEDGVVITSALIPGSMGTVDVTAVGGRGYLNAWADFNRDGDWLDAGEQIFTSELLNMGVNSLAFAVPLGTLPDAAGLAPLISRWRFSRQEVLPTTGLSSSGDVEDHVLRIARPAGNFDFGDAPDEPYPTLLGSNGARHVIKEGFHLGLRVDDDANGQPSLDAKGDDTDADGDDEDGVFFETVPTPGDTERVRVVASQPGLLDAWADWNRDGDWDDAGEQIFANEALAAGPNLLFYTVPTAAPTDRDRPTYARFRLSSGGGLTPRGLAEDGEVEDYELFVFSPNDVPPPVDVPTLWDWEMSLDDLSTDPPTPVMLEAAGQVVVRFGAAVNTDNGHAVDGRDFLVWQRHLGVSFDTEIVEMNLRGTVGSDASSHIDLYQNIWINQGEIPSRGQMMLTQLSDGTWQIDSFFDITYRIDFADRGMSLVPADGSTRVENHAGPVMLEGHEALFFYLGGIPAEGELGEILVDTSLNPRPWDILRGLVIGVPRLDWGDAPDGPYPTLAASAGAAHVIRPGYSMGPAVDPDANGQPHPIALGDDGDADGDDEDGIVITSSIIPGGTTSVDVTAVGGRGYLNAWADFNRNGVWEASEQIFTDVLLNMGVNALAFPVPAATVPDAAGIPPVISRWRFSRQKGLPTTGLSSSGEVEDHLLRIGQRPQAEFDFGDAPDKPYPTLSANNGASHKVVQGFHLGRAIDAELDGQPDTTALRDDDNGVPDDEDGVTFMTPHVPGSASTVVVEASAPGRLDAWIDFNRNGVWDSGVEHAFGNFSLVAGPNVVSFNVPADAIGGRTYARFRFSRDGGLGPEGPAPDGEVEDYAIVIEPVAASPLIAKALVNNEVIEGKITFPTPTLIDVEGGGRTWTQVLVPGVESILGDISRPAVPVYQRLVAIPIGALAIILPFIEQDNIFKLSNIDLLPFQPTALDGLTGDNDPPIPPVEFFGDPTEFAYDAETYSQDAPFPREIARFVPLGKMRDLEVGLIQIATGQYDPVSRELSMFREVGFKVEFTGGTGAFLPAQANNPFENVQSQYAGMLNAEVIYDHVSPGDFIISNCTFSQLGEELLILTHPDFRDAADLLHDWKEDKGIVTTVFEVGAGTVRDTKEEIYDLINERFDECTIRPSYLLLLGDAEFIPTWYRHTRYAGGNSGPDVKKNQDSSSGQWVSLGTAYFNADGSESVGLIRPDRDDDNPDFGATVADAVKFRNVATNAEVIVDNLDAGFSTSGTWIESSATDEFDGSSLISFTDDSTATFEPTLANEGLHEIYAWWSADSPYGGTFDRDSTAVYRIKSSNTGTDTPYVYVADGLFNILPDLANGRIPVDTLQQALDVVNKIVQYEQDPPGSFADPMHEFYDTATVASQFQGYRSGDPTGRDLRGFIEVSERARDTLLDDGRTVERIYGKTEADNPGQAPPNRYYDGALLPVDLRASSGFPWDGDAQDVIDAFNEGRFLITHRDHGGPSGWGTPGFSSTHVSNNLNNGELLPVVYSVNCASGIFDNETSGTLTGTSVSGSYFSERLIRLAGEGAVGVIGDTRNSNTWSNAAFYTGLIDATWTDNDSSYGSDTPIRRLGDIMNYAKEYTLSRIGVAGTLPEVDIDVAVDTLYLYHVFGDPTLEMWTSNPNPVILPGDITIGPIVDPKILTLTYGENGSGDGATLTVFQEINGVLTPMGRGVVENGAAAIGLFMEGDPDQPIIVGACRADAVCVLPTVQRRLDFGDAPDAPYPTLLANNGARHFIQPGFHLGLAIDRDPNGQPSLDAKGDDTDADGDDEDGVFFLTAAVPGMPQRVRVDASAPGRLDAFIDFNRDGDWDDAGEQVFVGTALVAGSNFLSYPVPSTAIADPTRPTYARFRFSSTGVLTPRGAARDGEVEDYTLFIHNPQSLPAPAEVQVQGWDFTVKAETVGMPGAGALPVDIEAVGPATFLLSPPVNTDNGMVFELGGPDTLPAGSWHVDSELLEMNLAGTWKTSGDADDRPTEEVAFYYNKIAFQYSSGGEMMLTSRPGENWHVDSFFDITYRIDLPESGMSLVPEGGSTRLENSETTDVEFMDKAELVDLILKNRLSQVSMGQPLIDMRPPHVPWDILRGLTTQRPRLDWGDAPDGPYPTLAASAGAAHVIRPGYSMGPAVDPDANGQPHPIALGDDGDADGDDEDGIVITSSIIPGGTTSVDVTAVGGRGYLNAWADFNRNGVWEASEQIFTDVLLNMGVNTLTFGVPATTLPDVPTLPPVISRWRFSRQSGLPTTGLSSSGEVEDHHLRIATRPQGSPEAPAAVVAAVDRAMTGVGSTGLARGTPRLRAVVERIVRRTLDFVSNPERTDARLYAARQSRRPEAVDHVLTAGMAGP